ncbi:F0F1 ATP synthase subunit B [Bacteroidetes bacterium endosymbiont of Geopemphigus sp.]|uniref:F0F1 ATP synthase subunit B n=1 Tax=Bacteroidetes bacterium endosymbiont of Geopemphigus sp. TaxID=2047937 RepID=UPI000CD17947|nr:F0F1 ATP synthase subunit B [Bacteroidetes bacterium endosymbiont of Geopemphigus sp.]
MDLVTPSIGLIFWQAILFILLFFLLAKFAWKPILRLIEDREEYLQASLRVAQKAQQEMNSLELEKEIWLKQSRAQRDLLLKETRTLSDQIIHQAKENAQNERHEILLQTKILIENQKKAALADIKNQVADLSISIAEKLLQKELKNDKEQEKLVSNLLADLKDFP